MVQGTGGGRVNCACGCGEPAPIAQRSNKERGHVKGHPTRYIAGHNNRKPESREVDGGYSTLCHEWLKARNDRGYGTTAAGEGRLAHRVIWERERGPVPAGLELDHLCRNRWCVNPDHLEPVTHKENMRRGYATTQDALGDSYGGRLRRARLRAKLSQADLAAMLGVTQGAIWGWETDRWVPSPGFAELLRRATGVAPDGQEDEPGVRAA